MKNIFLFILFLINSLLFGQKHIEPISFEKSFRMGLQTAVQFGNNVFAKDFDSGLGFNSSMSIVKIYGVKLTFGFEFQRLRLTNAETIGNLAYINNNNYFVMLEYELPINDKFEINPTLSYAYSVMNYKDNGNILAKQKGNEIRLGSYLNYQLNKTFAGYFGIHYAYFFNSNLSASSEDKDYFGQGNKIVFSIGIEIL